MCLFLKIQKKNSFNLLYVYQFLIYVSDIRSIITNTFVNVVPSKSKLILNFLKKTMLNTQIYTAGKLKPCATKITNKNKISLKNYPLNYTLSLKIV